MSKKSILLLVAFTGFFTSKALSFADSLASKPTATVLLPLYLDSLFNYGAYKYGNTVPKFALSALEFYNGVQMAADSLSQEGIQATIEVVDSRRAGALNRLFANYNPHKPDLVIGVFQNAAELKQVASAAQDNKVPVISATYPNDGGVTNNSQLLIVNSTLRTHCAGVYQFLQKRAQPNDHILVFVRQGGVDDRVKGFFEAAANEAKGKKLNWKIVSLPDTVNSLQMGIWMDSTKNNIVVGASLSDDFCQRIIKNLSKLRGSYRSSVYGMPTWDEYNLSKPEFQGVDVYFSTAFVSYSANATLYNNLTQRFKKVANSRPSDMFFKGFELTYRYVKTLSQHPNSFMSHVNDQSSRLFADFTFHEVLADDSDDTSYLENKKLYFIQKTDGAVKYVF